MIKSIILTTLSFFLVYFQVFSSIDNSLSDILYSRLSNINPDIIVIGIDEDTLAEYGSFNTWSRSKTTDLIEFLYSDSNNEPAVFGIDILFQGEGDLIVDDNLASACQNKGNIVVSNFINFKSTVSSDDYIYRKYNIDYVEYPYEQLNNYVISGFTNSFISSDNVSRTTTLSFEYNNKVIDSFSYAIAKIYANNKKIDLPSYNYHDSLFRFFYSGKQNEYSYASLKNVLDGKIPNSEFKDKIVLYGAYASGMQDSYFPTRDIGGVMNGVEVHANIIQALLQGKTATYCNKLLYSILFSIIVLIVSLSSNFVNLIISVIINLVLAGINYFLGIKLVDSGIIIPQIYAFFIFLIMILSSVLEHFFIELKRRKHIVQIFNRYMDPKIVNKLVKNDDNKFNLVGEKRNVAVLFVDIRGFTSFSESLDPEKIVTVLNEYLGYVTECVFKHNGMIDKFIGDAAMAVFNAPLDQEDYVYEAVAAAYDIARGLKEIFARFEKEFNRDIGFGIGVHCGEAVFGNIGSKTRMDYTAIGDTVNTASRLEGIAKNEDILISTKVYEILNDRIIAQEYGKINVKGKLLPVEVYKVLSINK